MLTVKCVEVFAVCISIGRMWNAFSCIRRRQNLKTKFPVAMASMNSQTMSATMVSKRVGADEKKRKYVVHGARLKSELAGGCGLRHPD